MLVKLRTYPKSDTPKYIEYKLNNEIKKEFVTTGSINKQDATNIISGGYNKQYSQPSKKELSELEK